LGNWHGKRSSNDAVPGELSAFSAQLRSDFREPRAEGLAQTAQKFGCKRKIRLQKKEIRLLCAEQHQNICVGTLTKSP
jgi:hypothetical protein